ncbi:MAG: helix-turn-helix transcriptional regulator [Clostridia bacterium]|nr:helix-turn-helix transcriptional regulator [Clostridia bacterium]
MKIQSAVAKRLTQLLVDEKISQYELAKRMATNQSTIKNIMHETYKSVNLETIIKIADSFNITFQEFFNSEIFNRENLDV